MQNQERNDIPLKLEETWQKIVQELKKSIAEAHLSKWIYPLLPLKILDDKIIIIAPNNFFKEWVESHYIPFILDAIMCVTKKKLDLEIKTYEKQEDIPLKEDSPPYPVQMQLSLNQEEKTDIQNERRIRFEKIMPGDLTTLNPKYTFDTFVTGSSNNFATATAKKIAETPGTVYNPFFIYGKVGLGKTHLMHAIGNEALKINQKLRILYISSEKFLNDMILSIRDGKTEEFRQKYRMLDILLVDDIQFLYNKEHTQEEFFHTFNELYNAKKQIIISSDRSPKTLDILEDRLRSRFEWGVITDIKAPDFETRIAILNKKIMVENLKVPNDVVFYIASLIDNNIRELEGALTRIIAYASFENKNVSLEIATKALEEIYPKQKTKEITIELIQEIVASNYQIKIQDLTAKSRVRRLVVPRQIAMYLCRKLTDISLPQIGKNFGDRDHTTVIHAFDKIQGEVEKNPKLKNTVNDLINKIKRI